MKTEVKRFLMIIIFVLLFLMVLSYLQSRLKNEVAQLRNKLYEQGLINNISFASIDTENLSKTWEIYRRKITLRDVKLKDILFQEVDETSRRTKSDNELLINLLDFLGILSYGLINDMKVVFPAFLISISFAILLPLIFVNGVRISYFVPFSITYIPPFLVMVLLFYFASSYKFLISIFLGILASTRLGIQLSNSVKSLENDDYVIYMVLGGISRSSVTFKYTYFELLDSIIWGSLWTFYTLFSLKIAMGGSLDLNTDFEINTGAILKGIFSELPSFNAVFQFILLAVLIAILFVVLFSLANSSVALYNASIGLKNQRKNKRFDSAKSEARTHCYDKIGEKLVKINRMFSKIIIGEIIISSKYQENNYQILKTSESMEIILGDKVFVKGPSGSGKTLLTNSIVGILWEKKLDYKGKVIYQFDKTQIDVFNNEKLRNKLLNSGLIELVPQNPKHGFNSYRTVKEQIKDFGLLKDFQELLRKYFPNIFEQVMKSINLPPSKINDGSLQVINFILTVARMRGKIGVILFDEPIASLSRENTERVYKMLKETIWDEKHIIFWIGHELDTIEKLNFTKILSIVEGENSTTATLSELSEEFISFYRNKIENLVCALNELVQNRSKSYQSSVVPRYDIRVKKIKFKHQEIFPSTEILVNSGDIVFINGENGSGKTTMVKAIVGYLRKEIHGEIVWFDDNIKLVINKSAFNELRKLYWKKIDAIFQNPDLSVPKYLKINEKGLKGYFNYNSREFFKGLLEKHNLKTCYNKRFYQLSYGEKKRVKMLRVLLKQPLIILLDEPTASLDIDNIELFIKNITEIIKTNPQTSLFIVTHQDLFQKVLSDKVKIIEMKLQQ